MRFTLVLLMLMTALVAYARPACEGILPKNNWRIPVGARGAKGLTEAQFNAVLDRIDAHYRDEIKSRGGNLLIDRNWSTAEVNAYADRDGTSWIIHMYGGLARHRAITEDGFTVVACHELGHHLGGAPKFGAATENEWASNEGEADYYATLKCLRRMFADDNNEKIVSHLKIPASVAATCAREHRTVSDRSLCERSAMASYSLSSLFVALSGDGPISFTTPDPTQVVRTNDDHPASQCRLDTYYHGALCTAPVSAALSDVDYRAGSCSDEATEIGVRPRCWFRP